MDFQADLTLLDQMMAYVRMEAIQCGMKDKALNRMEIACEEAIVNIISYAYAEAKGGISIECCQKRHRFEIVLRDQGRAFNPIGAELALEVDKPVHERRIGGLGIHLLRKIIDEASYQRKGDENVLRLAFLIE